ncbi:MAG TPA: hypothetical protein VEV20_09365, partial [Burkholderiales bacterium]|nr:hypothetical protein [Burkholderiales bacterium]
MAPFMPVVTAWSFAGAAVAALLSPATHALIARAEDAGPLSGCAISALAPTGVAALSWLEAGL